MTASNFILSLEHLPVHLANIKMEEVCGVQSFFECTKDLHTNSCRTMEAKDEYGDWQTNMDLAIKVCQLLKEKGVNPKVIIEPTCGKGHFILAALQIFDNIEDVFGIEIYKPYIDELKEKILQHYIDNPNNRKPKIHLYHQSVFDFNFIDIKQRLNGRKVLVLGNPPWVTNSKLGGINSTNLPKKTNFKKLGGIDAITGKSNFDIAEYICHQMIEFLIGENAHLAFLLKSSVIKNIVYGQQENKLIISDIQQYNIDAKKEFEVSVAAALLFCSFNNKVSKQCVVNDFYTKENIQEYGWINDNFVSDISAYQKYALFEGVSPLKWWSGIKHDCAKVMELTYDGFQYINGLGEKVDIEEDLIYPLLKSSDIKGGTISSTKRYVIVTQQATSDDTEWIKFKYPRTYQYLLKHAEKLDNRGSRIYKGRSRFCLFGIGKYSFKPYKIAVSGLYKKPKFTIVTPISDKSVMLDDTCYMLGLNTLEEATFTQELLNSVPVQEFINSIVFTDAKRVINKDLLMRIDLIKIIEHMQYGERPEMRQYYNMLKSNVIPKQFSLFY